MTLEILNQKPHLLALNHVLKMAGELYHPGQGAYESIQASAMCVYICERHGVAIRPYEFANFMEMPASEELYTDLDILEDLHKEGNGHLLEGYAFADGCQDKLNAALAMLTPPEEAGILLEGTNLMNLGRGAWTHLLATRQFIERPFSCEMNPHRYAEFRVVRELGPLLDQAVEGFEAAPFDVLIDLARKQEDGSSPEV